jgi:hypothetical protein
MNKYEKIIKSFKLKNSLNPKIWDNPKKPKESKMVPKVKDGLLKISEKFIEYLGDDFFVNDVVLTGSLCNFNWSQYSDFDLHVIIDFEQFDDDSEVYKELFDSKKKIFNEKHDIRIFKYDVELYAQDLSAPYFSSGTYSLMNDEWIRVPNKELIELDKSKIISKANQWIDKIESAISNSEKNGTESLEKLKEKLKKYRQSGLESDGELSYENIVFKFLRRSGHIEKLFDSLNKNLDSKLSIESDIQERIDENYQNIVNKSSLLSSLKNLALGGVKYEYSPGVKLTTDEDVKLIQKSLNDILDDSKLSVDGKFGPETEKSVKKLQEKIKIPITGVADPITIMYLVAKLVLNYMPKDNTPIKNVPKKVISNKFTYLDLNSQEGFKKYEQICQSFINDRNPSAGVTGRMMAECAKNNLSGGYIPPELALSQLALEGGLSKDPNARPIRTNNPFNVGNVDSGKNKHSSSKKDGVCSYYNLMSSNYLPNGKNPEDLLNNFVSSSGKRYASSLNYENKLRQIIDTMGRYRGI